MSFSKLPVSELQGLLGQYEELINQLTTDNILFTMAIRHRIKSKFEEEIFQIEYHVIHDLGTKKLNKNIKSNLSRIDELDKKFKKKIKKLSGELDKNKYKDLRNELEKLEEWRRIINPSQEQWWWFIDENYLPLHRRWDRLSQIITIICISASITLWIGLANLLLGDFLTEWEALLLLGFSIGVLLLGGSSVFTHVGRRFIESIVTSILNLLPFISEKDKDENNFLDEGTAVLSIVILLISIIVFHFIPSVVYNHLYIPKVSFSKLEQLKNPVTAKKRLESVLLIQPDNLEVNFKLGKVYQKLGQIDKSFKQYKFVIENFSSDNSENILLNDVKQAMIDLSEENQVKQEIIERISILKHLYYHEYRNQANPEHIDKQNSRYLLMTANRLVSAYYDNKNYSQAYSWLRTAFKNITIIKGDNSVDTLDEKTIIELTNLNEFIGKLARHYFYTDKNEANVQDLLNTGLRQFNIGHACRNENLLNIVYLCKNRITLTQLMSEFFLNKDKVDDAEIHLNETEKLIDKLTQYDSSLLKTKDLVPTTCHRGQIGELQKKNDDNVEYWSECYKLIKKIQNCNQLEYNSDIYKWFERIPKQKIDKLKKMHQKLHNNPSKPLCEKNK